MHPTLLHLPSPFGVIAVHAFGASLALSVLVGWYVQRRDARFRSETTARLYLLVVLVALLGARVLHLATTYGAVRGPFDVIAIGDGGLVGFGGLLAALALIPLVQRLERSERIDVTATELTDSLALPGLLAAVLTSLGAYLGGSDFGRTLSASAPRLLRTLGTFPASHAPAGAIGRHLDGPPVLVHQRDVFSDRLAADAAWSLPTHPVQLYEAALFAAVALGVGLLARRAPTRGTLTLAALVGYALVRLATDPFRGDPERVRLGATSLPFVLAALLAIIAAALLAKRAHASRRSGSAPAA